MKKYLLLLFTASLCFLFNAQAQIKKDAVLLGGQFSARNQKVSVPDSVINQDRNFNIVIAYGKAIRDNLVLGGSVSWRNQRITTWNNLSVYNMNAWGLGVFLRKYQPLGSSGFFVFAQGALNGEYMRQKSSWADNPQSKTNGWSATLEAYPGISYALTNKFHIETGLSDFLRLSYARSRIKYQNPVSEDGISTSLSFSSSIESLSSLYVGFRILLN